MTRVNHAGCEVGIATSLGPDHHNTPTGSVTRDTSIFRSGAASWKCDSGAGNAAAAFEFDTLDDVSNTSHYFFRFYMRFEALPASTVTVMRYGSAATPVASARLTSGGKLQLWNDNAGTQIGSDSSVTIATDGTWYRIEMQVTRTGTGTYDGATLRLDGTEVATGTFTAVSASPACWAGWYAAPGANKVCYVDDFALNSSDGSVNNSWPGEGKVILLRPISDSQRGNWTGGSGGTTNLWDAVDNTPPIGTASESDTTQIESVDSSGDNATDEYRPALTTYTDGGIGASDTINGIRAWIYHGEDASPGTKAGSVAIQANPAAGAYKGFNYGLDAGALGTWPTGWHPAYTALVEQPSVTLGSSPVLAVRNHNSGTRVASVCFMGLYVEYSPAAGATVSPGAIALSLAPVAPSRIDQTLIPGAVSLALAPVAPSVTATVDPAAVGLSLAPVAPARFDLTAAPGAIALSLAPVAPRADLALAPSPVALALAAVAPELQASVNPEPVAVAVAAVAPTVQGALQVSPAAIDLALAPVAPARLDQTTSPAAIALSLAPVDPALSLAVTPALIDLAIAAVAPARFDQTANPPAVALVLGPVAPSITGPGDQTVSPAPIALTLAAQTPARIDLDLRPAAVGLVLEPVAPQRFDLSLAPGAVPLVLAVEAPAVGQELAPPLISLTLTAQAPTRLDQELVMAAVALALAAVAPSVSGGAVLVTGGNPPMAFAIHAVPGGYAVHVIPRGSATNPVPED